MPLILRAVKGSKLTISEMDGNLTYLSSTLSGSIIQVTGSSISAPSTSITASSFVGSGSGIIGVVSSSYAATSSYSTTLGATLGNDSTGRLRLSNSAGNGISDILKLTASLALTSSYITASNIYGPYGSNSVISASYALTTNTSSLATTGSNIFTGINNFQSDVIFTSSINIANGSTINPDDDVIELGDSNNRFRSGYISRTFYVGDPSGANIGISTFARDGGSNFVGSITLSTGSGAPSATGGEGQMFVGKAGANYYIYVYIGGQWRSSSLA